MITIFLAGNGGAVQIPDAVAMTDGDTYSEVHFVDAQGKVLATFARADLAVYSDNGLSPAEPKPVISRDGGG